MDEQRENNLLDKLRIMEVVENELERQKNDAVLSLVTFLCGTSVWVLLIALWHQLGEPLGGKVMTMGIEVLAVIMLVFVLKFTRLDIRKMGVTKTGWKSSLCRGGIISAVALVLAVVIKLLLKPGQPLVDWGRFNPLYMLTAVLQEFLARGFLLTCLLNIIHFRRAEHIAVITSSLLFTTLHLYYGFTFMIGAGILSVFLGYVYLKDRNIWGVSLLHFCLGMIGMMFQFV